MQIFCKKRYGGRLAFTAGLLFSFVSVAGAQQTNFGLNLSGGKEPLKIDANDMEMRDKEGIAIFSGNVSVVQGDRMLRAGKMIVYYSKPEENGAKPAKTSTGGGLGSSGIDKMEASGKVYIKSGTQVAIGDQGTFNGASNVMVLTGAKVVLTDGENVATGCKLTAHMDTGKAFLESCPAAKQKGRVSIIMNRNDSQN